MAKDDPISSENRTKLFIKNLLKTVGGRFFSFAFHFNQLKSSLNSLKSGQEQLKAFLFNWWQNLIRKNVKKIVKQLLKKQILHSAPKTASAKKTKPFYVLQLPKLKSESEFTTALIGWGLPKFKFKIQLPKIKKIKLKWPRFKTTSLIAVILVIAVTALGLWQYLLKDLPHPRQLAQNQQRITTKILSQKGEVLFKIYEDENRSLVKLENLPQHLINATIAIEDKNFYHHLGFSPRGIIRATIANSQGKTIEQGGSTITQQLVKNRLLSPEKTIQRKLKEIILSVMAEFKYSKQEILEMYLNQVAYGGAVYGIEEAAQRYFGKKASQLNLAESAMLAGLPVAPSVYSPFGPEPELNRQRQAEVLRRMVEDGYISPQQATAAREQVLNYQRDAFSIKAPHFVMYVRQLLTEQYGQVMVNQGGLVVTTTLDWSLQQEAQELVGAELEKLARLRVSNGAALVTNPQTGEVLAMVGSKDYFDFAHDGQVNVTLRPRQPGSSIKPLTYALALESGFTPGSIIDDSPITYHTPGSEPYSPVNYDGQFHGRVTLREALASSYNVPAVKTLAQVGVSEMIDQAQLMGIETWEDRSRFGLSLTLGGGEVRMVDMAELYSTFATGGFTTELNPILEVKNARGETLYRNTCVLDGRGCARTKSLSAATAYQITDILADNQARTPAFGPRSVLYIPNQKVAVKTGTTNNLRDNWTVGYTTSRLVATWVGNNDNTSMSYVASGVTGASPIWNKIMRLLLDPDQPHQFPQPKNLIKVRICAPTGTLPCSGCPMVREELFKPGTEPQKRCQPGWFDESEEEKTE